jgi:hypothetical protein
MSSDISYPPADTSGLMPRTEAEATIADFQARITALEGKKALQLLGATTIGETTLLSLALGVRRYSVTMAGALTTDRLVVALTGAPTNGTVQDAYVSAANTVSVGVLAPALGIGATIAVPVAVYKVV